MSGQQFDKYIKEQFSNYAPDVHPRIWENIAARKEKKKPVGFWFSLYNNKTRLMVAALLLTISCGGAWWLFSHNKSSVSPNHTEQQEFTRIAKEQGSHEQQNGIAREEKVLPTGTDAAAPSGSEQQDAINGTGNKKAATDGSSQASNNINPNNFKARKKITQSDPRIESAEDEALVTESKLSSNKTKKRSKGMLRMTTTAPGMQEKTGDNDENELAAGGSLLGRLTYDAELISARKKTKPAMLSLRQIAFLPDCPSIEKNAAGNKKYIEAYAGPDYAIRILSDTGNSEYLKRRKESTKFSSAFSAGLRYTRVFSNSMSVRAGINYSQINEKFTFSQGNVVQITYIIGTNGDTLGSFTTVGTRYKTTTNKYNSFDIPLAMGYEIGNGKWHANINAGVVVNVYSWQKGDVLDTAYKPVSITTGKASSPYQFKTNAGVGFIGGVSVYYKLNDRIHLMAEPYFRYNLSPMNKDNITLKQKYQTAGIRLGIRFDLH